MTIKENVDKFNYIKVEKVGSFKHTLKQIKTEVKNCRCSMNIQLRDYYHVYI